MATHRANAARDRAKAAPIEATDDAATAKSGKAAAKGSSGAKTGSGADAEPKSVASTAKARAKATKPAAKAKWLNPVVTPTAETNARKGRARKLPELRLARRMGEHAGRSRGFDRA